MHPEKFSLHPAFIIQQMKITDQIKTRFGISQRMLAQFIGADQSHLNRYCNNTRSLPAAVQSKLTSLYTVLSMMESKTSSELTTAEKMELNACATWCRSQCIPLQKRLATTQLHFRQATALLQFLKALKENTDGLSDHQQRWIAEQQYQARKKKSQNSLFAQQKLLIRIELLRQEAELNETAAGEVSI